MPIPFHDAADDPGTIAYLHIEPADDGYAGVLFQITTRGEPVEFTWNRVSAPASILWRPGDLRRAALRLLTTTLFETCPIAPALLVVRADTLPPQIFTEDLAVEVPVLQVSITSDGEIRDDWLVAPAAGSAAATLAATLGEHGLLLEPFERAAEGLKEVGERGNLKPPARENPHPPAPSPGVRERG